MQCLCHWENGDNETVRCELPAMHIGPHQCGQNYHAAAPLEPIRGGCYSPGLEHNRCQAGHPIHHDTTGRYEADTWVHCSIADVVSCPHDSEQIIDVRPGKHRVTS